MIGEALAATGIERAVLARIGGAIGEAARAAHDQLASPRRRALRLAWSAAARAPVPPGLRGIHASWIEAALAELPPRARADLARGAGDPVAVWLTRWACAALPPMPAADWSGPPDSLDVAVRLRGDALASWLAEVGADQLALALGAAGGSALAAAQQVVGMRLVRAVARIDRAPRAGGLGPVRAAIARCRGAQGEGSLVEIGARAIAPHTDALARRRLAVRLPRPLGLAVLDALAAFAETPLEHAPLWRALAAPVG